MIPSRTAALVATLAALVHAPAAPGQALDADVLAAKAAYEKGDRVRLDAIAPRTRGHPLEAYVAWWQLKLGIDTAEPEAVKVIRGIYEAGFENLRKDLVRRRKIGARQQGFEPPAGSIEVGIRLREFAEPLPQTRSPAPMGERKQVAVVVEAEQRPLQDVGEGKIVLGQQKKAAERHEILHRKLLAKTHPVGARHGDRREIFTRAEDRRCVGRCILIVERHLLS